MNSPLTVTFTLTRDEIASAIRHNMLRAKMILLVLALLVYMGLSPFVTYLLKHSQDPAFAFPRSGLAYTAACFAMIAYLVWLAPLLAARRIANREQTLELSGENDWVKVRETGRFFFLTPRARTMQILPKRAFASTADLDAFRELLKKRA